MFELAEHGPDTYVGTGPEYPWGGLYGGQIVAQALRAAAATVEPGLPAHSLRAYFIQRGDHQQPVRYEVDRIRNGRSFATRRVVARQPVGAILNFEASFQRVEASPFVQAITAPSVPGPEEVAEASWSPSFSRRLVAAEAVTGATLDGGGRVTAWMRVVERLDRHDDDERALLDQCWLAYLSDDVPSEAVLRLHPASPNEGDPSHEQFFGASLDHTIWFHRPVRVDAWHLYDGACQVFSGARGLTIGHVFSADGAHVATIAQEFLARAVEAITSR